MNYPMNLPGEVPVERVDVIRLRGARIRVLS